MARVSTSATCAAYTDFQITANFDVWESGTSVGGNYSTVSWHLVVARTNSGGTFYGSTRNHAGWVYCGINGQQVYGGYTGLPHGMTNGTVLVDRSGSVNVGHNDDGTKTVDFYVDLDQSDDDYGHINYYFSDGPRSTGTLGLTTIARASQPSINTYPNNSPDITAGTACTIHMNRKAGFTHNVSWSFGSLSGKTDGLAKSSGVTDSVSWTPPVSMMAQIPNSTYGTGSVSVTTYNGGTAIGTKTVSFTLHQPSDANPSISASYTEAGTLADGETTLSSKGVAATTVIGQISVKKITIRASAKYSASIKSIACTHNGQTQVSSSSSATFTFNAPVNTGSNKSYFSWTVIDSRGNSTSGSTSMTYVNYIKPVVAVATPSRDSAMESTGKLSGNGIFFNGTVGSIANSVSITYTYNSASHTASVTKSGNNWSFSNAALSGVDPNGNYSITVKAVDTLGFSSSKTIVLPKSTPTLWIGKETVHVNNYLMYGDIRTSAYRCERSDVGTSGLFYLGRWTSGDNASSFFHLKFYSGSGYNGQWSQNTVVDIFAKDGWQSSPSATGAFGITYTLTGHDALNGIYVAGYAIDAYTLDLYMQTWDYDWGYIFVEYGSGKWEPVNSLLSSGTPSGTYQSCRLIIPGHPVGSIYISTDSTNPAYLFGGSWTEITGQFLLAHDSSHPAGSTGGEYTHTLTVDELPYGTTRGNALSYSTTDNGTSVGVVTNPLYYVNLPTGGKNEAHNNTPPYLSVYMWRRTA